MLESLRQRVVSRRRRTQEDGRVDTEAVLVSARQVVRTTPLAGMLAAR